MKRPLLCVLTAAWLTVAGPGALADTTPLTRIATLLDLCGLTRGDGDQALSMADRAGWSRMPAEAPPSFGPDHRTRVDARFLPLPGGARSLTVTQADVGGHASQSCSVADWTPSFASSADMALVQDALAKWVGGEPVKKDATAVLFAFREGGGGRRPHAANDPALSADIPPAEVVEVTVTTYLGMCARPLRIGLRPATSVRSRPVGADPNAMSQHVADASWKGARK